MAAALVLAATVAGCGNARSVPLAAPVQAGAYVATQAAGGALRVTRRALRFGSSDGAEARRAADASCGGDGVEASIYDRYDDASGAWVYPGGCE